MMSAKACEHKRILNISSKADDRQFFRIPHLNREIQGYAPYIKELCGGDYVHLTVCLDCCIVLQMKPISDEELLEILDYE